MTDQWFGFHFEKGVCSNNDVTGSSYACPLTEIRYTTNTCQQSEPDTHVRRDLIQPPTMGCRYRIT